VGGLDLAERDRRDRLYELSLTWAPPEGRFSAMGGRLGASPFVSLGYLDGFLAEARPSPSLQIGGFFGRTPVAEGLEAGSKYGAFARVAPRTGRLPYELVLAGVRENAGGEVSREYLAQEGQSRAGRFWFRERLELDLNRGWREERAGQAAQLTEARLSASWRPTATQGVTVSYERRRGFWNAFNRSVPGEFFDDRPHQTLRADLDLSRAGGSGLWVGGSRRTVEGDQRPAYSVHAGVRTPDLYSLAVAGEATLYQTIFTRGVMASARANRDLRGGHRVTGSYIFEHYSLDGQTAGRTNHRLRLSGYGQAARRAFFRADLEYGLAGDLDGARVLLEAGYRF
jgi:hypothetical protein